MLDFMIIGLPRSATTWASNFFTTERAICLHDPLYEHHYEDLDRLKFDGRKVGVACTGLWRFPTFVSAHPAKKIILRRSVAEVNASLDEIGLPPCSAEDEEALAALRGFHFPHTALFNPNYAKKMCEYIGIPFDVERHQQLVKIEMQPEFSGLKVGPEVTRRLVEEIRAAITQEK